MRGVPPASDCGRDGVPALALELPATISGLVRALESLDQCAAERQLDRAAVIRLRIVIEELVTNTIKYGYGGECAQSVRLRLFLGERTELIYEDAAPGFDPLAWHACWKAEARAPDGGIGRQGIPLILGFASEVRYQPLTQGNRLILTMKP